MSNKRDPLQESAIEAALLTGIATLQPGQSLDPAAVARDLAGPHQDQWGPIMQPLRRTAARLAEEGRLVLLRKGRVADPAELRGLYRLGAPRQD